MSVLKLPSSRLVRLTIKGLIASNSDHINGRMRDVDLTGSKVTAPTVAAPTLQYISHSFRQANNLDIRSLPSFQIEDLNLGNEWKATSNQGTYRFRFRLWGLLTWEHPEEGQDLISEYAAGVSDVLNQRHIPIPIAGGYYMYWNGIMPVADIELGAVPYQNALCFGFNASYACDIDVSLPDSATQSRVVL